MQHGHDVECDVMDRYRLPRWVNTPIDWRADHPMSLPGRVIAKRLGRPMVGAAAVTAVEERAVRVLIAPVNYSGQGREWARALERRDARISAQNLAIDVPGGFSYAADVIVPVASYHNDHDWQRRQFQAAIGATHVLVEAEEPPFGRLFGRSVSAQVQALIDRGVSVAYLAHGTDVRLPSRHLRANPWSHYADPTIYTPRLEALARRNIDLLTTSGLPMFVSTPDLILDLPDAHWCPVVVEVERWNVERRPRAAGTPLRVAHAPSVTAVKGTELIMPTLSKLHEEGVITVDLIRGVPSSEMPARFATADVVIDQFRIGSYGAAACEAMASGCLVVGHVDDRVRTLVEDQQGETLPIIEATTDTIEQVLRDLAAREDLDDLRADARGFVRRVHDGRRSADVLTEHWINRNHTIDRKSEHHASPR